MLNEQRTTKNCEFYDTNYTMVLHKTVIKRAVKNTVVDVTTIDDGVKPTSSTGILMRGFHKTIVEYRF